ncbi:MAG: hypothetical protein WA733_00735 [Methylocystis sp.]
MQNGDESTGGAARSGQAASFADKAWTSLATTAGMFLVPGAYWALDTYGPSSRVLFLEYFPFLATLHTVLATAIGAWLGTRAFRLLRPQISYSAVRLTVGCLTGGVLGFVAGAVLAVASLFVAGIQAGDALTIAIVAFAVGVSAFAAWLGGIALFKSKERTKEGRFGWLLPAGIAAAVAVWLVMPQFTAFPSGGSLEDRQAWARLHMRQFSSLMRTVQGIPLVTESVGRVTAIAPASGVQQLTAADMDGMMMNLVLDVVGEKGAGTLRVECTIDGDTVFQWQPGFWTMDGKTIEIVTVPNLLKRR